MTRKVYTSDLHLDHKMIIKHTHRPFDSVEEQFEVLVNNFNKVLHKGDILYVVGDVGLHKFSHLVIERFLRRINATEFHLIVGNHDSKKVQRLDIWTTVSDIKEVRDNGKRVILCHYPLAQWNGSARGSIHLFGHSHGTYSHYGNSCDIGIDCWSFRPIVLDDILHRIGVKKYLNGEMPK